MDGFLDQSCDPNCESLPCEDCPESPSSPVVCRCFQVSEAELVEAIERHELTTLREVRQCTNAGRGCNSCHRLLKQYLAEVNQPSSSALPICSVK